MAQFVNASRAGEEANAAYAPEEQQVSERLRVTGSVHVTRADPVNTPFAHLPRKDGEVGTVQSCIGELPLNTKYHISLGQGSSLQPDSELLAQDFKLGMLQLLSSDHLATDRVLISPYAWQGQGPWAVYEGHRKASPF